MLSFIGVILMTVMSVQPVIAGDFDYIGMLPEIEVTASRYEGEDIAYSGMLPEIVITAPRYLSEADMGMLEQVVITASRYKTAYPIPLLVNVLRNRRPGRANFWLPFEPMTSSTGNFN